MSTESDYLSGNHGSLAQYSRHDLLLALMPLPLLVGATVGATTATSMTVGLSVGSLLSLPLVLYATVVDPPVPAAEG